MQAFWGKMRGSQFLLRARWKKVRDALYSWYEKTNTHRRATMNPLQAGDPAPEWDAEDQQGKRVRSVDFKGRKLFIFFYPKANTSG
jgi:peroxiredoxin Q/BCP